MIIMSISVLLLVAIPSMTFSQERQVSQAACSLINRNEFPQFISYERVGEGEPNYKGETRQRVWLRIHNNTSCAIIIPTGSTKLTRSPGGRITTDLQEGAEVVIRYEMHDLQRSKAPALEQAQGGTLSVLPAGHSVIFSVPASSFTRAVRLRVPFAYEWEGERPPGLGPVIHDVQFDSDELPSGARGQLNRHHSS